jgi:H+-transporting ATPase
MSNPLHADKAPVDLSFDAEERTGLTSDQALEAQEKWGLNELPEVIVPLWWVFVKQFLGTMPYMLEICIIITLIVKDYIDFSIILAMLILNGLLGFDEELKAIESIVRFFINNKIICILILILILYFIRLN